MKSLLPIPSLLTTALALCTRSPTRTKAPVGCLTVSKSGGGNTFTTIQSAISSLSTTSTSAQCVFISPGTYTEQVLIPARKAHLTIYGSTADTASYKSNAVTIISSKSQADGLTNDETAAVRVKSAGLKMYNVNVSNTYGKGSQAVALSAYADSGYYGCAFTGYQDTLLAQTGKQVYSKCLIQGVTDFVFGQHAAAWFEGCDIRVLAASIGYITASGRPSSTDGNYYVFNGCTVAAAAGNVVKDGAYYLGRPWAQYARVVFQKSSLSSVVNPAGWRIWNTGDERTGNVMFGEVGNTGAGAAGTRASFATKLASAVGIETVLGGGYAGAAWFNGSYFS